MLDLKDIYGMLGELRRIHLLRAQYINFKSLRLSNNFLEFLNEVLLLGIRGTNKHGAGLLMCD
jgi:hypothetical protein